MAGLVAAVGVEMVVDSERLPQYGLFHLACVDVPGSPPGVNIPST